MPARIIVRRRRTWRVAKLRDVHRVGAARSLLPIAVTMRSLAALLVVVPLTAIADPVPQFVHPPAPLLAVAAEPEPAPAVVVKAPLATERAYADRWSREIGASAGFMVAPKFHNVTLAPSFGWFIADNVQVSTILALSSIKAGADTSTIVTATIEPSYHYRLDTKTFAFAGMGFGYSYIRELGHGLTYTMRVGSQFLFGRRSMFVPSISYDFRTNKQNHDPEMESLAAVASERSLRINLGYSSVF